MKKSADVRQGVKTRVKKLLNPRSHSLNTMVWVYFTVFALFIMLMMWIIQLFFLESYYRTSKINSAEDICVEVENNINNPNIDDVISNLAFKNGVCIVVTDYAGNVEIQENNLGRFSFLNDDITKKYGKTMYELRGELLSGQQKYATKFYENNHFESDELICASLIKTPAGNKLVYVETTIEPVTASSKMFNKQLFFITVILIELSFIVAIVISKKIARPIVNITEAAKKFGEGDMEVEFKGEDYREAAELSDTLNRARDEISKVSNLRRDLIANVSHDLRTPLTMIKAYAEMIRDLSGDNPEKRAEHINVIIEESDRLSGLVNTLLELSKLESGNAELHKSEFSVHSILDDVMKRYGVLTERDGYSIELIKDTDRLVTADYEKISQVLYNFINNAVNYCGDDKRIQVRQKNNGPSVRIEIIDHGVGISKEMLPVIFDRYYRGNKTQREVVGSGIGLSIVKGILKSHSFPFGVMSEEGKGSVFWFEFPASAPVGGLPEPTARTEQKKKFSRGKNKDNKGN